MKKHKIIDCIFFYDELDMLKFRMTELNDYVDYFIIMENNCDFKGEQKPLHYLNSSQLFKEWENKIIYLDSPCLSQEENDLLQKSLRGNKLVSGPIIKSVNRKSIQEFQLNRLYEFLLKSDFYLEDIIMISDVDEIPDLTQYNELSNKLIYGPVVYRQKDFIWSSKFVNTLPHYGTSCILYTELILNPQNLFRSYFNKNSNLIQFFEIMDSGYHFSHFYDIEKTKKKIYLMSDESHTKIDSHVENCWNNLLSLETDESSNTYCLVKYDGELPKNINLLENQPIGRDTPKKHFVSINSNIDVVEQYFEEFGDTVSIINFTSDPLVSDSVVLSDKITQYNMLIPNSKYYDIFVGENTFENFQKMFGVNEIKKILQSKFPLDTDLFVFYNGDKPDTLLGIPWEELKNEFLYDKLESII